MKKTNTTVALRAANAETAKAETATLDPALLTEALQEQALQEASDEARGFFKKAAALKAGGKLDLCKVMERKAKFIFARRLRMACAKLGVEVPARG